MDKERSRSLPPVRNRRLLEQQEKERELAPMKRQVERLSGKIQQMESRKKWTKKGNEKQFQFASEFRQVLVEDL